MPFRSITQCSVRINCRVIIIKAKKNNLGQTGVCPKVMDDGEKMEDSKDLRGNNDKT